MHDASKMNFRNMMLISREKYESLNRRLTASQKNKDSKNSISPQIIDDLSEGTTLSSGGEITSSFTPKK